MAVKLLAKASQSHQAEVCSLSLSHANLTSHPGQRRNENSPNPCRRAPQKNAEHLLTMGLHPSEIGKGYMQVCEGAEGVLLPFFLPYPSAFLLAPSPGLLRESTNANT